MDGHELHAQMHETMQRLKCMKLSELSRKISRGEFYILKVIRQGSNREGQKGVYVSELAKNMKVTAPAISRMLKSLEDKGLVQREVDKNNRRNTFVFLTEQAAAQIDEMEAHMNEFMTAIIARMGEENVKEFMVLFNQMADAIEAELAIRKEQKDGKDK